MLRERREMGIQTLRLNVLANVGGAQWQQMPQPQVWLRRQKIQQQAGLAPMEGVERINIVIVHSQ